MKILVLGSTGATGLEITKQALAGGHEVTALARRPDVALESLRGANVVFGDARDAGVIASILKGQDAVVSALGLSAAGSKNEEVFVCTDAVTHILQEFGRTRSRRLVVISTHGVNDSHDDSEYVARVWDLMGERLFDKEHMEQLLFAADDGEWTIVRSPRIDDGRSGKIIARRNLRIEADQGVDRELLAAFVVGLAESDSHLREALTVIS